MCDLYCEKWPYTHTILPHRKYPRLGDAAFVNNYTESFLLQWTEEITMTIIPLIESWHSIKDILVTMNVIDLVYYVLNVHELCNPLHVWALLYLLYFTSSKTVQKDIRVAMLDHTSDPSNPVLCFWQWSFRCCRKAGITFTSAFTSSLLLWLQYTPGAAKKQPVKLGIPCPQWRSGIHTQKWFLSSPDIAGFQDLWWFLERDAETSSVILEMMSRWLTMAHSHISTS